MNILGKKGDLWKFGMILVVSLLLFGTFIAVLSFAETPEEEKARLEAELADLEGQLSAIDGGRWVNNICGVEGILYNNWNCDGSIGYHIVKILT